MIRPALALLLAAAASTAGAAGAIYRCGPDGRTYSQTPCADGKLMESADPRSAAQRAEAKKLTEAERKAAAEQERQRKAAEQSTAAPGNLGPAPAASTPAGARGASQSKPATNKDFVAAVPGAKPASAPRAK